MRLDGLSLQSHLLFLLRDTFIQNLDGLLDLVRSWTEKRETNDAACDMNYLEVIYKKE